MALEEGTFSGASLIAKIHGSSQRAEPGILSIWSLSVAKVTQQKIH